MGIYKNISILEQMQKKILDIIAHVPHSTSDATTRLEIDCISFRWQDYVSQDSTWFGNKKKPS